jgi:PAS domain S-box-containing protein
MAREGGQQPGPVLASVLNGATGDQIGQIELIGLPGHRFDADDHTLLQELAQIASISLQKVWADQRSRADRDQLENVLDSMSDAVFMLDTEWRFTFLNDYARRLLGDTHRTLLGAGLWQQFPELHDTDLHEQLQQAVASQCDVDFEFLYERFDAWFHFRAFPSAAGLTVYFQDITEQRSREDQLRQAQKLEAMGQLTGGVAHDFNNLLTVILGNTELLAEMLNDQPRLAQLAQATAHAALRGSELTAHLLAFARRQPLNPRPTDLSAIVAGMHPMLARTLGENVSISLSLQPDAWPVMVDSSLFEGVVLNLVLNARDAMPQGGQLSIRLVNIALQPIDTVSLDDLAPGDYVGITVSDSGVGMSREALARVFDPFFTTKDVGKGSGLGLSMVHGFVKQSGGAIRIYSRPSEGTTVQIYLPRSVSDIMHSEPVDTVENVPHGSESVLVVEDEDMVRDFVCSQIRALGYSVVSAANGPQALEMLEQGVSCDLLFTDIMMPGGLNGRELAERACRLDSDLKVVFTSGYSDEVIMRDGRLESGTWLLKKPYRKVELATVLREALAQPARSVR